MTTSTATAPNTSDAVRIDTAELSKIIKKALTTAFPTAKFSVRLERYSGGSSIRVNWTDGPAVASVEDLVGHLKGKGFDGMIDMEYSRYHWLHADGSISLAGTRGTEGSRGTVEEFWTPQPEGATLVYLGSGYLSISRESSPALLRAAATAFTDIYGKGYSVEVSTRDFGRYQVHDYVVNVPPGVLNAYTWQRKYEEVRQAIVETEKGKYELPVADRKRIAYWESDAA